MIKLIIIKQLIMKIHSNYYYVVIFNYKNKLYYKYYLYTLKSPFLLLSMKISA
jgi:hypothetical protein